MSRSEPFPQPNVNAMTAGELWAHRDAMEASAASLLGRMLFEYSRIDVNLGLCLVWVDDGAGLERLTPKVAALSFPSKLNEHSKHTARKLPAGSNRIYAWTAASMAALHGRFRPATSLEKVLRNPIGGVRT